MVKKESTPISIRLSDDIISSLKSEARRISYDKDSDINYVDLIRDAVAGYISGIEPKHNQGELVQSILVEATKDSNISETCHPDLDWLRNLNENEWLSLFELNFNSRLSQLIQHLIIPILELKSTSRAVLIRNTSSQHSRDVSTVVFFISRRGAVPDQIQEGEDFFTPTFEVAVNPVIRIKDILSQNTEDLVRMANTSAEAIAREEDSNFYSLISGASQSQKFTVPVVGLDQLFLGYDAIIKRREMPKHLLLSPSLFMSLSQEAGKYKGNWKFETLSQDNKPVGHFHGSTIRTCDRLPDNEAYFLSESRGGGFIEKPSVILINLEPQRLRCGFIICEEIGMFIADSMVSCVAGPPDADNTVVNMGKVAADKV